MARCTCFEGGKWRIRIGDTEQSGRMHRRSTCAVRRHRVAKGWRMQKNGQRKVELPLAAQEIKMLL